MMNVRAVFAWPRRIRIAVLLGLLALSLPLGLMLSTADAAPPADRQQVRELLQTGKASYPAVVARVNDHPIDGQALARRVYIVQHSQAAGLNQTNVVRTALDQLVAEEVLIQAAPARGIVVTEAEARAFAQDQLRLATQAKDGSAQEIVAIYAVQLGVAPTEYFNEPGVIETYRRSMIVGRMRSRIAEALPAVQRADPAAQQSAIQAFVAQSGAQVEELITL